LGERRDIPDIMNALDLYCSASAFGEGFPNVVGEAMSCSVPCIVTDVGHSAIVVGTTGFVVPPGQHSDLAQGMTTFLSMSAKERDELGNKAQQRIEANYSISKVVKQYEDLYFNVVQRAEQE
jgi:glycosyltransferase involved in cell wall biosynthesis